MYSVVSSFTNDRHVYGCDWCGKEDEGKPDDRDPARIRMPIGWCIDCGPGRNPNQIVGIFCSSECRDDNRRELKIVPRFYLKEPSAITA